MKAKRLTAPAKLGKEPLLEVVCEIRFSSVKEPVIELLTGILYQQYKGKFSNITSLPAKNLPSSILENDPALRYIPTIRLDGDPYAIQVGEHVVSLSCRKPYTGWNAFKAEIETLVDKLKETNLITNPERFSLKYIDIIPSIASPRLSALNVEIKLGDHSVTTESLHLRTEKEEEGFVHIIQIGSPVSVNLPGSKEYRGLLLDIDTIKNRENDFWSNFSNNLERAHDLNKVLFFSILATETINSLDPKY